MNDTSQSNKIDLEEVGSSLTGALAMSIETMHSETEKAARKAGIHSPEKVVFADILADFSEWMKISCDENNINSEKSRISKYIGKIFVFLKCLLKGSIKWVIIIWFLLTTILFSGGDTIVNNLINKIWNSKNEIESQPSYKEKDTKDNSLKRKMPHFNYRSGKVHTKP